eukprot:scaffold374385_cov20-Prasinocladus_malaysianus.AAC.2
MKLAINKTMPTIGFILRTINDSPAAVQPTVCMPIIKSRMQQRISELANMHIPGKASGFSNHPREGLA